MYEDKDPAPLFDEKLPGRYPLDQLPELFTTAAARLGVALPPQLGFLVDALAGLTNPAKARRGQAVVSPLLSTLVVYAQRE